MKYLSMIVVSYLVLVILDAITNRNHKKTNSLEKFSIRTIPDVSIICAIGALLWIGVLIWGCWSEAEVFYSPNTLRIIIPISVIWLGVTFYGMIAPLKGVWEIKIEQDDITVIKAFIFKKHWKISNISYCELKRGGMNVYVKDRKRKAFFIDAMTDHIENFKKRMEQEGIKII